MPEFHVKATVGEDGSITVAGLPLRPGQQVEVTVEAVPTPKNEGDRYLLRGTLISYTDPFDSVAETDWEVLK